MNPARSAPASAATATSSSRVSPQTLTSGRRRSSRSFAAGSGACIRAEPTRIASAPASSAAAPCARVLTPLSAIATRSAGIRATSASCVSRSISKVERSRALTPMTGAPEDTARSSSSASCASTSVSRPSSPASCIRAAHRVVVEVAEQQQHGVGAGLLRRSQVLLGREEALREQRNAGARARGAKVVPVAAEALVDEHGDGRCAGRRVRRAASWAGSASGRMSPSEGERRLISAIAPRPGPASASLNRIREPRQLVEPWPPRHRSRSAARASSSPSRRSSACPAAAIAPAALSRIASRRPPSAPAKTSRIACAFSAGVPPRSSSGSQRAMPELDRVDHALVHVAVDDLADVVRPGRRELVDPERAVDDERAPRAELREHVGDRPDERFRIDADHLRAGAGGVRERAEHVEHGTRREVAPNRRGVAHRGVVRRREHEAEAELVDRLRDPLRRLLEPEAERFEHVRRPGRRRDGAVAVLRDAGAGRRSDDRGRGRDVDRAGAVAAGAGRVDEVVAARVGRGARARASPRRSRRSRRPSRPSAGGRRGSRRSAPASRRRA